MWQGPHGQNESAQRQRSEVALTALHTTGKGILAKMLTLVFDKSEFSRIYNETYYYKILVGITLSVRIAFINRRRLTYMALFSRLVCENTGNASTSDMGCCADSDDYSPTNFLGYTIIK